jgi:hypothetical protein
MRDPRQMSFAQLFTTAELARSIMEQRAECSGSHRLALDTLKALNHIDALEEQLADLRGGEAVFLEATRRPSEISLSELRSAVELLDRELNGRITGNAEVNELRQMKEGRPGRVRPLL